MPRLMPAAAVVGRLGLIAEDRGARTDPLPRRGRSRDLRVRNLLSLPEIAGGEADRAQPQLAARVRELLGQPLQGRTVLAHDPPHLARQPEANRILRCPD